jgi:N6-adenosine-specific RNA methylase IME4/ParB-like chromosome segregation protein Spo0J
LILKLPSDLAKKIAETFNWTLNQVTDTFNIEERKDGYFYAQLKPKKFLDKPDFQSLCTLVRDLDGEDYLAGAKAWRVPGPYAKKTPSEPPSNLKVPGQSTAQTSTKEISQSSELALSALSENEDVETLRGSVKKVGPLYPVLVSSQGDVIDGFHRLKADHTWPRFVVESVADPVQLAKARLISNERRTVPAEEKAQLLREIIVYTGWNASRVAEELGWNVRTVYRYLPADLKAPEPEALSRDRVSRGMDKNESSANLQSQETPKQLVCARCGEPIQGPAVHLSEKDKFYDAECAEQEAVERKKELIPEEPDEEETLKEGQRKELKTSVLKRHALAPIPNGPFDVVYADPPWDYNVKFLDASPNKHYATLEVEEIAQMRIPTSGDAVLFLWTTNPFLDKALKIMDAWGFTYKTNMVWIKPTMGLGFYFRGQHELLLMGVKGNVHPPEESKRFSSVLQAETGEHSAKPAKVYEIIEAMYPSGRFLELFARQKRANWVAWGDEAPE